MRQKEKESYIQAMLYMAKIDGIKRQEELRVIRELAEKLNVENIEQKIPHLSNELSEGKELRDVLSHVHGRTNKLTLIYQLVVLAYADGTYSPGENDALIITVSAKEENYLTGYQMIYTRESRNIPDGRQKIKPGNH